jgi:protein CpxP
VNKRLTILSAAMAIGLGLSCATVGHAQDQRSPAGAHDGGRQWDPAAMKARFEARRQARAQLLHDALGLRPDQDGAWQAFLAEMRPPEGDASRHRHMHEEGGAPLTTPERLDRMAQRMGERQARFQHHAEAVKRFYTALDARQQKAFDAITALRGGERGRMGGHGMDGHHGFGGGPGAVG